MVLVGTWPGLRTLDFSANSLEGTFCGGHSKYDRRTFGWAWLNVAMPLLSGMLAACATTFHDPLQIKQSTRYITASFCPAPTPSLYALGGRYSIPEVEAIACDDAPPHHSSLTHSHTLALPTHLAGWIPPEIMGLESLTTLRLYRNFNLSGESKDCTPTLLYSGRRPAVVRLLSRDDAAVVCLLNGRVGVVFPSCVSCFDLTARAHMYVRLGQICASSDG